MRSLSLRLGFSLLTALAPATAFAAANASNGEQIARRWCAACHIVAANQKQASADVAPFADVARRKTDAQVANFLTDPHPKMPDMSLSRQEIADIVAYIRSLAPQGPDKAP
jgi:mono/diheme cytochrome c family protein